MPTFPITETERARITALVIEYCGDNSNNLADKIIWEHDFSYPDATHIIEISGSYTKSRNHIAITINKDEIRWDIIYRDIDDTDLTDYERELRDSCRQKWVGT